MNDYRQTLKGIDDIKFRKKTKYKMYVPNKFILPERIQDLYTFAFLNGLDYTENCYSCKYARLNRISDITIGDAWGSELSDDEKKKGISLILCQTERGSALAHEIEAELKNIDFARAVAANRQLNAPSSKPKQRKDFFAFIHKSGKFNYAIRKCYPKEYRKQKIKLLLLRYGIISDERE